MKRLFLTIGMVMLCLGAVRPVSAAAVRDVPVLPEHAKTADITVWEPGSWSKYSFATFEATFKRGGSIAVGDVDGDGADELVIGAGPGRSPDVRVYATDGKLEASFRAYAVWFKGGVRVGVGDVDGDGKAEIVTAPGPGLQPEINVFSATGTKVLQTGVLAYVKGFEGGVHVAVADVNADGVAEIVTTPGPGGGSHVRIFNGRMETLGKDFFAFDASMRDGTTLAILRTPGGPQIVTGVESWSTPYVRRYSMNGGIWLAKEFIAFDEASKSGVNVSAVDYDSDGTDEIAVSQNGGTSPEVRFYDLYGSLYAKALLNDPNYRGALSIAQTDADRDGKREIITMALSPVVVGPTDMEKAIRVDLNEQRLYAYERGRIANTFLISSGTRKYPTPEVNTKILEKIPVKRYKWSYGPNHPDNYDLPNVKWNMRIYGSFYIHAAYWHNNFGYRMSHGCINTSLKDANWIYHWADVGTPVFTAYGRKPMVSIATK